MIQRSQRTLLSFDTSTAQSLPEIVNDLLIFFLVMPAPVKLNQQSTRHRGQQCPTPYWIVHLRHGTTRIRQKQRSSPVTVVSLMKFYSTTSFAIAGNHVMSSMKNP